MTSKLICPLIVGSLVNGLAFVPAARGQRIGSLENAFPELTFTHPVFLTHAADTTNRIFVVEKPGVIKVLENNPQVAAADTFLDIRSQVNDSNLEMGLLCLAFHPDLDQNPYCYVTYTTGGNVQPRYVLSRFLLSAEEPVRAIPDSEVIILEIQKPFVSHNAGMIGFGPDGYLYASLGDGGGRGDPLGNGQNATNLFGTIMRLDVDHTNAERNYVIPQDNPFVGNDEGYREEIWAYGFRNPWRFSFDAETGLLWVGDVGQYSWEEIDLAEKGKNYGWNVLEGTHCFEPETGCDTTGLSEPIKEYAHSLVECSAVAGGYVYRGQLYPELEGAYIFGDFCSGGIGLLRYENNALSVDSTLIDSELAITSFGLDQYGELYVLDYNGGIYHVILKNPDTVEQGPAPEDFALAQNYPNPFNPGTIIEYHIGARAFVELNVYSILGEKISSLVGQSQAAGTYRVRWDGHDDKGRAVAAGVYLYRLEAGSVGQVRKMILMR